MARKLKKIKGFAKNAIRIAKRQKISKKSASAILAVSARKASTAAKRKNPSLMKVTGIKKLRKKRK